MKLQPLQPPGRSNRKARAFAAEIVRLHGEGYTLGVIREALATAGVQVSTSTVLREIKRKPTLPPATQVSRPQSIEHVTAGNPQVVPNDPARLETLSSAPSGREVAEAFFRGRITNPLLRQKFE